MQCNLSLEFTVKIAYSNVIQCHRYLYYGSDTPKHFTYEKLVKWPRSWTFQSASSALSNMGTVFG